MLSELDADQLVHRKEYPQIPPKVEYRLTMRYQTLIPITNAMCEWDESNRLSYDCDGLKPNNEDAAG